MIDGKSDNSLIDLENDVFKFDYPIHREVLKQWFPKINHKKKGKEYNVVVTDNIHGFGDKKCIKIHDFNPLYEKMFHTINLSYDEKVKYLKYLLSKDENSTKLAVNIIENSYSESEDYSYKVMAAHLRPLSFSKKHIYFYHKNLSLYSTHDLFKNIFKSPSSTIINVYSEEHAKLINIFNCTMLKRTTCLEEFKVPYYENFINKHKEPTNTTMVTSRPNYLTHKNAL